MLWQIDSQKILGGKNVFRLEKAPPLSLFAKTLKIKRSLAPTRMGNFIIQDEIWVIGKIKRLWNIFCLCHLNFFSY